jgi:hypothetical protein
MNEQMQTQIVDEGQPGSRPSPGGSGQAVPPSARENFESFLMEAHAAGCEVRLVPMQEVGKFRFYAHLNGKDGSSVNFWVENNQLTPVRYEQIAPPRAD